MSKLSRRGFLHTGLAGGALLLVPTLTAQTTAPAAPAAFSLSTAAREEPDYAAMVSSLRREEERTFAVSQSAAALNASLFDDGVFTNNKQALPIGAHRVLPVKKTEAKPTAEFDAVWGQNWNKPDNFAELAYNGIVAHQKK
jgi:hypothetical protein